MTTTSPPSPHGQQQAGWYPDPNISGQLRWWDGSQWTENVHAEQQSPAPKPKKPWYRRTWVIVTGAILAIFVIAGIAGGASDESSDSGSDQAAVAEPEQSEPDNAQAEENEQSGDPQKPNEASDDNTPHAGPNGQVTVDGLVWSIDSVRAESTLGDASIGLAENADGVFLVVRTKVHSTKGETVTMTDDVVKLEGGSEGATYSADLDGSTAAMLSSNDGGDEPFIVKDIQPDTTTTGTVVFDVPRSVLRGDPELRFNELGFGETHAYIALPQVSE